MCLEFAIARLEVCSTRFGNMNPRLVVVPVITIFSTWWGMCLLTEQGLPTHCRARVLISDVTSFVIQSITPSLSSLDCQTKLSDSVLSFFVMLKLKQKTCYPYWLTFSHHWKTYPATYPVLASLVLVSSLHEEQQQAALLWSASFKG